MTTPIVLVHGLIGSLQFPALLDCFAPGQVLAPDLLGYGALREVAPAEVSIPAQVEHLRATLQRQFGSEPVHLLGHSVGGVVAALFAHRYADRVSSLVSVEGNFSLRDAFWSASVAQMSLEQVKALLEGFRGDPAAWLEGAGVKVAPPAMRVAEHWLAQQPAATLLAMAQSVVEQTGPAWYQTLLRELFARLPVHLIAGERSRAGWDVPGWAERAAASQGLVAGCGHLMMLENPAAFAAAVRRALSSG